uniref:Microbial-type PARG catalytic domain-containing protein n=1 Tax=Moniliophthora roreri TaxID=221103 RepID=A0A0W0FLT1_MONRR
MAPSLSERQAISKDTIARSESITEEHVSQGATLDSTFINDRLPRLDPSSCPDHPPSPVEFVTSDTFTATRNIIKRFPEAANNKVGVLNLASDELPGGGWNITFKLAQEDSLCYSSTLFETLKPEYYPWPNLGPGSVAGVFSPGIVIFKDDLNHNCKDLESEERRIIGVITVAAPRGPKLTSNGKNFANENDLNDLREKIRLVYRMAARNGREYMVLGAMGCGTYRCPAQVVAEEMKMILLDPEFRGWFRNVTFAIRHSNPSNGPGNFGAFEKVFEGTRV